MALTQLQRLRASRRTSRPEQLAAPIKGWNTRDPFEQMDPLDAILIDNWDVAFQGLVTRNGSLNFATGMGSVPVQTLAWFNSGTTSKFLAGCNGKIFDITAGGAIGAALASGFTSDIWQTANFNKHQFWANGHDIVQSFDGTTISASTFTGVSLSSLTGVGVFNNRLYFWTGVDAGFWFGPVNGITGALSFFDFSMVTLDGGALIAIEVLSYDGGTGVDDYTCFFMSSGEVLMYAGTDPSNANNFALVGRYKIGAPVAIRAIARYGGDVYMTTANDHQQLSKLFIALKLGETPPPTKASGAATTAYQAGASLPGWQALYYPEGKKAIFNIPNANGSFSQHVYSTSTQAWSRYAGLNAYTLARFAGKLYFGSANGVVIQADIGNTDNGSPIQAIAQQAWNTFQTPLKKVIRAARPVVQATGMSQFSFSMGFDFKTALIAFPDTLQAQVSPSLTWGVTNWGSPNLWGASQVTDPRWNIGGGEGAAIGLSLAAIVSNGPAWWMRSDLLLEPGANL